MLFPLLLSLLLHLVHGFLGEFLSEHALHDVLLARAPVANHDHDAARDVAGDGAAEDDSRQGEGTNVVVDAPCAGAKGDLEDRVEVEDDDDGDEEAEGKSVVGDCFVGFVEGV